MTTIVFDDALEHINVAFCKVILERDPYSKDIPGGYPPSYMPGTDNTDLRRRRHERSPANSEKLE